MQFFVIPKLVNISKIFLKLEKITWKTNVLCKIKKIFCTYKDIRYFRRLGNGYQNPGIRCVIQFIWYFDESLISVFFCWFSQRFAIVLINSSWKFAVQFFSSSTFEVIISVGSLNFFQISICTFASYSERVGVSFCANLWFLWNIVVSCIRVCDWSILR